jgi:hypothetical protein
MKLALNLSLCLQSAEQGASGLDGVLAGAGVSQFLNRSSLVGEVATEGFF